jgi:PAS domain S-box-containing protein
MSLDPEGNINFLNHYGDEFFGYSGKEIFGKPMLGTLTPAGGFEGRDLAGLDGLKRDPNRYAFSVNQNMLRNGQKVWIFWANKGIYDDQGQVKELLRVGLDITERERRVRPRLRNFGKSARCWKAGPGSSEANSKRSRPGSRRSARSSSGHGR